jgi:hypothetical protein
MPDVTSPFAFPYPEDTDLVRDGATDIENLATGVNDYLAGGYLYQQTVYYTSSGSFVKADYPGLRAIRVRMVGGGGGGSGASASTIQSGAGGGGGDYSESFITDIAGLDASVVVTRGSGGAGSANNAVATAGGDSSFGSTIVVAKGGREGQINGFFPGPPTGSVGNLTFNGDQGVPGGLVGSDVQAGAGGSSALGSGGPGRRAGTSSVGSSGLLFGGGGSGGKNQNTASDQAGGAGANGIVIIDVFV